MYIMLTKLKFKGLPADKLHCFNFFTVSIKMEYLKLVSEVVPANSNVTKPINLTSGCPKNPFLYIINCWLLHQHPYLLYMYHLYRSVPSLCLSLDNSLCLFVERSKRAYIISLTLVSLMTLCL